MMVGRAVSLNIDRPDPVDPKPRLKIEGLTCVDNLGVKRLDDVTFTAMSGEILGIAGIAGSGQRELLECITGLYPVEHGTVTFLPEGKPAQQLIGKTPNQIRKAGVAMAFVPEDRLGMGLVGSMGMGSNMMLRSWRKGKGAFVNRRDPNKLAMEVMEELEVVTPQHLDAGAPSLRRQRAEGARRPRDRDVSLRPADGLRRARSGYQYVLHHL
mgnify:CR=1 FL=1